MGLLRFKQFIIEGGNIGQAAPFPSEHRAKLQPQITKALEDIHGHFKREHNAELFGSGAASIKTGSAFAGSTKHFFDKDISDSAYSKAMPHTGDIDVQADNRHADTIKHQFEQKHNRLMGKKFGNFEVVGHKNHGTTSSMVIKHPEGHHIQVDIEHAHYEGDHPHEGERFVNSSDFGDRQIGAKGVHHKLMLHAIAKEKGMKFSAIGGLKADDAPAAERGLKHPNEIDKKLFDGKSGEKVHSFRGLVDLTKQHFTPEQHQSIASRFTDLANKRARTPEHTPKAIAHMHSVLDTQPLTEARDPHADHVHVATTVMTGVSPISHMGHHYDLGSKLQSLPGKHKFFAMSRKGAGESGFTEQQREHVFKVQSKEAGHKIEPIHVGEHDDIVNHAWNAVKDQKGPKHLHLVAGGDRLRMITRIKQGMDDGRIHNPGFEHISVHTPEDTDRSHGMSGTKMRKAAAEGNIDNFHKFVGKGFTKGQANEIMSHIKHGIESGAIQLDRTKKKKK